MLAILAKLKPKNLNKRIFAKHTKLMGANTQEILLSASLHVLKQLKQLAQSLGVEQYSQPLPLLSGNTIGKHYRHIIEFYQCLLTGNEYVNYDKRERNAELEINNQLAAQTLQNIMDALQKITVIDAELTYEADFDSGGGQNIKVKSSMGRELAYNIEHAVHHMAIIKIVVGQYFSNLMLEENFGVAASTLRYQQQAQ